MNRHYLIGILVTMGILGLAFGGIAVAQSGGPFEVPRFSIDGGGGTSLGGPFVVRGTAGQPDAGTISGGTFQINGGFSPSRKDQMVYLPLILRAEIVR